jgi:hypothetical protein
MAAWNRWTRNAALGSGRDFPRRIIRREPQENGIYCSAYQGKERDAQFHLSTYSPRSGMLLGSCSGPMSSKHPYFAAIYASNTENPRQCVGFSSTRSVEALSDAWIAGPSLVLSPSPAPRARETRRPET